MNHRYKDGMRRPRNLIRYLLIVISVSLMCSIYTAMSMLPTTTPVLPTMDKAILTTATIRIGDLNEGEKEKWSHVKLAIYMTTHLPPEHIAFLPCWNDAIRRLEIFKYADLILYTTKIPSEDQLAQLPFRNVTVKLYKNPGHMEGAIQAMIDPFVDDVTWFDGYDWVIRLNMDVLIRHDTWLIRTMIDPTMNGIFHDCVNPPTYGSRPKPVLHTDFYAFRRSAINLNMVRHAKHESAEWHMTQAFRNIYDSKQFAYLIGAANPVHGYCRIVGLKCPVIHLHELSDACPNYYDFAVDGVYYT
jgi:hypothetical protein